MTLRTNGFVLRIAVLVDAYELLDDLSSAQVAFGLQELPQLVLLGRRLEVDVQPFRRFEFFQRHCLCDLYGYIVLSFDSGDELLQGRARVEDFALDPIPAHDKAAGRVVGRVAAVDQDAQKVRHVVQVRRWPCEARAVLHGQPIASRGDCRAGIDFPFTPAGGAARRIGTRDRQFANRVFERIAEIRSVDMETADRIVRPLENTGYGDMHLRYRLPKNRRRIIK